MVFAIGAPTFATDEVTIQILHTNDQHARVLEGAYDGMGFAKLKTEIDLLKKENPNTLLLDAGDIFHGQTIATLNRGESIVNFMNLMGYDYMTLGNHDFNYGYERTLELEKMAEFDIVCANVYKDGKRIFTPYEITEVNGVKIAIFGLATPETLYKTHPDNVKGLEFRDPVQEAKDMAKELKEKADVLICLAHIGLDEGSLVRSDMIAEAAPEIDLIVDGHSHTELPEGKLVNGVLIASAKEYNKDLGIVTLTVKDGEVTSKTAKLFTKEQATDLAEDETIKEAIAKVQQEQSKILETVVSNTPWELKGERGDVRTKETNLGSLIADAMLSVTKADASLTNGGGIRASIAQGDITKGNIITVLPFGNYIITKEVKGEAILAALEHGVDSYPNPEGKFPHVGNLSFDLDPTKEAGNRVSNVKLGNMPLDLQKTYTLATNDYLAAGGDGYEMFKDAKLTGEYPALDEALITYLNEYKFENEKALYGRVNVVEAKEDVVLTPSTENYKVKLGDVLWKIAKQFHLTWQELAEFNHLKNPNLILEGQTLLIPVK